MRKLQKATLVYIDNGYQWLMLYRNKRKNDVHFGKWIAVGGKVEPFETPMNCAIREVFEETGLTVESIDEKGVILFENFTPNTDWEVTIFKVSNFFGKIIDSDEGTLSWIDYTDILTLPTWEGDYIFNQWILQDKPYFKANFIYEDNVFKSFTVDFDAERK